MAAMARVDAFPAPARAAFSSAPRGLFESPGELVCELLWRHHRPTAICPAPAAGRLCRRARRPVGRAGRAGGDSPAPSHRRCWRKLRPQVPRFRGYAHPPAGSQESSAHGSSKGRLCRAHLCERDTCRPGGPCRTQRPPGHLSAVEFYAHAGLERAGREIGTAPVSQTPRSMESSPRIGRSGPAHVRSQQGRSGTGHKHKVRPGIREFLWPRLPAAAGVAKAACPAPTPGWHLQILLRNVPSTSFAHAPHRACARQRTRHDDAERVEPGAVRGDALGDEVRKRRPPGARCCS